MRLGEDVDDIIAESPEKLEIQSPAHIKLEDESCDSPLGNYKHNAFFNNHSNPTSILEKKSKLIYEQAGPNLHEISSI